MSFSDSVQAKTTRGETGTYRRAEFRSPPALRCNCIFGPSRRRAARRARARARAAAAAAPCRMTIEAAFQVDTGGRIAGQIAVTTRSGAAAEIEQVVEPQAVDGRGVRAAGCVHRADPVTVHRGRHALGDVLPRQEALFALRQAILCARRIRCELASSVGFAGGEARLSRRCLDAITYLHPSQVTIKTLGMAVSNYSEWRCQRKSWKKGESSAA